MSSQRYVVGFLMDDRRVALIRKNRPDWQAGLLNGIGGHVEADEDPDAAMRREFWEEADLWLDGWERFLGMTFPGAEIDFYRLFTQSTVLDQVRSLTDEPVVVIDRAAVQDSAIVPNLSWLVPLAAYRADNYEPIDVRASVAETLT